MQHHVLYLGNMSPALRNTGVVMESAKEKACTSVDGKEVCVPCPIGNALIDPRIRPVILQPGPAESRQSQRLRIIQDTLDASPGENCQMVLGAAGRWHLIMYHFERGVPAFMGVPLFLVVTNSASFQQPSCRPISTTKPARVLLASASVSPVAGDRPHLLGTYSPDTRGWKAVPVSPPECNAMGRALVEAIHTKPGSPPPRMPANMHLWGYISPEEGTVLYGAIRQDRSDGRWCYEVYVVTTSGDVGDMRCWRDAHLGRLAF